MAQISMAMLEEAGALMNRLIDLFIDHDGAHWLITATQPFGNGD